MYILDQFVLECVLCDLASLAILPHWSEQIPVQLLGKLALAVPALRNPAR